MRRKRFPVVSAPAPTCVRPGSELRKRGVRRRGVKSPSQQYLYDEECAGRERVPPAREFLRGVEDGLCVRGVGWNSGRGWPGIGSSCFLLGGGVDSLVLWRCGFCCARPVAVRLEICWRVSGYWESPFSRTYALPD